MLCLEEGMERVGTRFLKVALEDLKVSIGYSKPPKLGFTVKFTSFLKNWVLSMRQTWIHILGMS